MAACSKKWVCILIESEIKKISELEEYLEKVKSNLGITLPLDYLQSGRVYVYRNAEGQMMGGYLINAHGSSFRLLDQIPETIEAKNQFLKTYRHNQLVEVNGLWISPRLIKGRDNLYVWYRLTLNILKTRRPILLISANVNNTSISRYHDIMKPVNIYVGPPQSVGGSTSYALVRYAYVKRLNLALLWPRSLPLIWKRLFPKKRRRRAA